MAALSARGVTAAQFDVSLLESVPYRLTSGGLMLGTDEAASCIPTASCVRGWLRRLAPPEWRRDVAPSSHEGVVRASWVALLIGIADGCGIEWLSDVGGLFTAENKIVQHAAATALGISVPASAIVSSRDRIPASLGDEFIAKPLGPGQFEDGGGEPRVVFTRLLSRGSPELEALAGAPFLLQQYVAAERHLRVVTVRERFWIAALDASDLPVDWRRNHAAHDAFVPSQEHGEVGQLALRIARKLRVGYSSQDWVISRNGESVFLDLNPGGQWLFLPEPVRTEVTEAIAAWLAGEESP